MADEEVLELGSDGTFELPPTPLPASIFSKTLGESIGSSSGSAPSAHVLESQSDPSKAYLEDAAANAIKSISMIEEGGYKIYEESDSRFLSVVIRFRSPDERAESCRISASSVDVTTSDNTTYHVHLPNAVKPETATCSTCDNVSILRMGK